MRLGITKPPVDVESIAKDLKVRIEKADFGEDVSGILVRSGDKSVIGVNWSHHPNRQRFTIAHELGHLLLHKHGTYIDKGISAHFRNEKSGSGSIAEEREANLFAASVLMPEDWVRREFEKHRFDIADDGPLAELARLFGVSAQSMSIRIANLRLVEIQ